MKTEIRSKAKYRCCIIGAFAALVFLAVVYPPCRITAVATWMYVFVWSIKSKRIFVKNVVSILVVCTLLSIPVAYYILFVPSFNARSLSLLTFKGENYIYEFFYFIRNFTDNLSLTYLFVTGDIIKRHSMPFFGVLGTINIVPFFKWIKQKWQGMDYFLIYVIGFTFLSVALTNEYQPHTLRSCLAWMPFGIILARGWESISNEKYGWCRYVFYVSLSLWYVVYYIGYIWYYTK